MSVVLYSTHCPKCNILTAKLDDKGINYEEINDVDLMMEKGFTEMPVLEVDGELMGFMDAIKWVNDGDNVVASCASCRVGGEV